MTKNQKIELRLHKRHLKDLIHELEKRLKKYHRLYLSDNEKARRLKVLRQKIIDTYVAIEELSGSTN